MKQTKYIYLMVMAVISKTVTTNADSLEAIIAKHATKPISVYINANNVSHLGFGNCDFLRNGEDAVVKTFIKPNDVIFDVGAHVGGWTQSVLQVTNAQCRIYAFEPVPQSYRSLEKLKNQCDMLFTFNVAIGKEETETEMHYFFERGSDCSTLFNRPVLHDVPVQKIRVPVTYLDKIAQEYQVSHVNFLKIDTEGAELDVLMGAHNLIENNAVDIIQFEYGGTYPDAHITLFEVYHYLTSHQYIIFRIIPNGLIYIPAWDESLENFSYSNYLALKK